MFSAIGFNMLVGMVTNRRSRKSVTPSPFTSLATCVLFAKISLICVADSPNGLDARRSSTGTTGLLFGLITEKLPPRIKGVGGKLAPVGLTRTGAKSQRRSYEPRKKVFSRL